VLVGSPIVRKGSATFHVRIRSEQETPKLSRMWIDHN
jgi:hypothetical protein